MTIDRADGFSDEDARRSWNEGADAWLQFTRTEADYYRHAVHGPGLLRACGDVAGLTVIDLGCGEGYFSRELARRGARVVGVELAEAMLRYAQEAEAREPLGIRYLRASAAALDEAFAHESMDRVTACMSLQDMADIPAVVRAAQRVLKSGGRFLFSVPHPFSEMTVRRWERDADGRKLHLCVDGYFESGAAVCDWNMPRLVSHWATPYWRRTLSEWADILAGAGLVIRALAEPRPSAVQVAANPALEDCYRLPYFLVLDALKS